MGAPECRIGVKRQHREFVNQIVKRTHRLVRAALIGAALGIPAASVVATEGALHIRDRLPAGIEAAQWLSHEASADWRSVQVRADDGALLDGWLIAPRQCNGSVVILLHGVGD